MQNGGSEADACDIMQEGLVAVYYKATDGNFVLTCPFEAFLLSICKRQWLMHLRSKGRQPVTNAGDMQYELREEEIQHIAEAVTNNERYKLLDEKFYLLGDACRQLLQLAWSGKPLDEVALLLNNSYGYIRKKKSECIGKLAALIKNSPHYKNLAW